MKRLMPAKEALKKLKSGNKRFASGLRSVKSMATIYDREQLAVLGQRPFAVVLTCSDSRSPAEIIFDQGLGDLFVIRVAGNIAAVSVVASIEFALLNLGTPLCVVMGHTGCGAVKAMIDRHLHYIKAQTPNLQSLIDEIAPSVELCDKKAAKNLDKFTDEIVLDNVKHTIARIREMSTIVRNMEKKKEILLVGAIYDIHQGKVTFQ